MRYSIIELKLKGVSIADVKGFSECLGREVKPRFIVAALVRLKHIKNGKTGDTRILVAMLFFPFEKAALHLLNIWFLLYDSDTSYGRVSSYPLLLLSLLYVFSNLVPPPPNTK